ncbi:MAG TPA: phosphoglucosamine mutase [Acidimicrobiales bacterium]|nr:phosphoglucosamine mutase [Acidimicrobiales bacterium]
MSLRFGTDGVRGVAGSELTPELVLGLGRAAARVLGVAGRPFVIGRDTRWSGPLLQAAFSAGVAAEGIDVVDLGVLPTPGVAWAASSLDAPAAVISASHNPFADNGIKLLSPGGRKLSDEEESTVEAALDALRHDEGAGAHLHGRRLGRLAGDPDAADRYRRRLVDALEGRSLAGVRVALDCGNGAAVATAAAVFEAAGATVVEVLSADPDGTNINAGCGSTDPGALAASVVAHGAAAGLAFDGDADRVIAVDDRGRIVDGDRLIALLATDLHQRGRLSGDAVAVTVMTNLGFHRAMAGAGIKVASTAVGDRYVLEALESNGWSLGGEQSGHIIFRDLATTGDGVLTGLLLVDLLARRGTPLSAAADAAMQRLPQMLRNVQVADHTGLADAGPVWDEVRAVEAELGDDGRVLLRPSGTEKLVRVMVEAPTEQAAGRAVDRLARAVLAALGPPDS